MNPVCDGGGSPLERGIAVESAVHAIDSLDLDTDDTGVAAAESESYPCGETTAPYWDVHNGGIEGLEFHSEACLSGDDLLIIKGGDET